MRNTFIFLIATGALLAPDPASAQATTRIETRPFYGATVTLEEGVRVFRSLPSHDRVIINPGGRTPLNLAYEQHHSTSENFFYDAAEAPRGDRSFYGGVGAFGDRKPVRHHDRGGVRLPGGSGGGHGGHGPGPGGHR